MPTPVPRRWSVAGLGGLLVAAAVLWIALDEEPPLVALLEVALPLVLGVALAAAGVRLARSDVPHERLSTVAAWTVGWAVPALLAGAWMLFIVRVGGGTVPEPGYVYLNTAALAGTTGTVIGYLVTGLRREQDQSAALIEDLRRQNERLEEFAGIVAHDLRNPLNIAYGHVEHARETGTTEPLADAVDALDRMERLLTDTLTLAREGAVVDAPETVGLEAVARRAWGTVEAEGAALEVNGDVRFRADRDRLVEALGNLFGNAVTHGGPDVTVRVGALDGGFYVEDDGPGVPDGEREAVFEPGYTTDAEGTGFGLAIVRRIAEAHGWTVTLVEGSDGGARFEFAGVETI